MYNEAYIGQPQEYGGLKSQAKEISQSAISGKLDFLDETIAEANERANGLAVRLDGVMMPESPTEKGDTGGTPKSGSVLSYNLEAKIEKVQAITRVLENILQRLEL